MRIDIYLSKVGLVKRRAIAKDITDWGLVRVNNRDAKPSTEIREGDIIRISGKREQTVEILKIPTGNVKKEDRPEYYKILA
jgi:ribosomal 50S subunit-recycling heat shock protein